MATTPSFPSTIVARAVAGLYDIQLGNATMSMVLGMLDADTDVGDLLQMVYDVDFAGKSYAEVATIFVANLQMNEANGLTAAQIDLVESLVVNALTATGPGAEGDTLVALANLYSTLDNDAALGASVRAFNTQVMAAVNYAEQGGTQSVPVHPPEEALNLTIAVEDAAGFDAMRLTGDTDIRIDFTNSNHQITGVDIDGDGLIEFNGVERTLSVIEADVPAIAANRDADGDPVVVFEIVDAYSRNPLDHTSGGLNYLGDIYFDGTSYAGGDGDGTGSDGNIFLGGLGSDTALAGVGNDFLAGGGVGQFNDGVGFDYMDGGRNADFFFAEFSLLDNTDGGLSLSIRGGDTSDDQPKLENQQSAEDSDWLLLENSDDDEAIKIWLDDNNLRYNTDPDGNADDVEDVVFGPKDGNNTGNDGKGLVYAPTGEHMVIDDIENIDASGNLYGFLDDLDVELGGRAIDDRDEAGDSNYGIGTSAQLQIYGSSVGNIIIAGYDNDYVEGNGGSDLLMGGNLQQLLDTIDGLPTTNPNLANIPNDGLDYLIGGAGFDDIVFEADEGVIEGGEFDGDEEEYVDEFFDTLWLIDRSLGTASIDEALDDGVLRIDLGAQRDKYFDADGLNGMAGYGGADTDSFTADQSNYADGFAGGRVDVNGMEAVDATGLGSIDYLAAGANDPDLSFNNQQNFWGYDGDLDLRGTAETNFLFSGAGDDVLEGRTGDDLLMGGGGNDDFYFAIDGDNGVQGDVDGEDTFGDGVDIIWAKVDADNIGDVGYGIWDEDEDGDVVWGPDFGQIGPEIAKDSSLTLSVPSDPDLLELTEAVGFVFDGVTYKIDGLAGAQDIGEFSGSLEAALAEVDALDGLVLDIDEDAGSIKLTDPDGNVFELAAQGWFFVNGGIPPNGAADWQQVVGEPETERDQDRLIYKSYEDRSDNEAVDDDAVTGSTISLGKDAYAEDLVVDFDFDSEGDHGTRLAEDQEYAINFFNLTTEDVVTVVINGVTYTLEVGVKVNGTQDDDEDGIGETQLEIQDAFLERFASFINSFMDDDTAAGSVVAEYANNGTTIFITQKAYNSEETVFMREPVVDEDGQASRGEKWTSDVFNISSHEVLLYEFDGRDNNLNFDNVLFWGDTEINRSKLETAANAGDTIDGTEAVVINGGFGPNDDDIETAAGVAIPWNTETDDELEDEDGNENFAVHGDDYLIGGNTVDTISGLTGDDRVRGSLGNDRLDGGKDWYAVDRGEDKATVEYLNAYEAEQLAEDDEDVVGIDLIEQYEGPEDGDSLLHAPEFEEYFDDTLIYHQADFDQFTGKTRFTITLNNYIGLGEDLEFDEGGAGQVGVDKNGDGTVEPENVSNFTNFENIRTVSGIGNAVAGDDGGQGRDTLNIQALSNDSDVGVLYDLTGLAYIDLDNDGEADDLNERFFEDEDDVFHVVGSTAGDVVLLEDTDGVLGVDQGRQLIKVDGVENVIFGNGNDELLIDETEAAKDNVITGNEGTDQIVYLDNFTEEDGDAGDDEPTMTIFVGAAHPANNSSGTDLVEMTNGRVGTVKAVDTLNAIEFISVEDETATGIREDDTIDVQALSGGAVVNYVDGKVYSDTDGDLDFDDGTLQLTIIGIEQFERVVADGKDAVIVADADTMYGNVRTDVAGDELPLRINTFLNYDKLDQRDDIPERLTVAELNKIPDTEDDTDTKSDIPEAYNFAQFSFILGEDTDTVDYSEADDDIAAVIDVTREVDRQYVLVDGSDEGDGFGTLDDIDDDGVSPDRVDLLDGVEQIVASLGESVIDLTAGTPDDDGVMPDVTIDFQFSLKVGDLVSDGYELASVVRISDADGNEFDNLTGLIERWVFNEDEDGNPAPNVDGDDDASWSRVEGSDGNEKISYEGALDITVTNESPNSQAGLDHRYSADELNLRGGLENTVSYFRLPTSIDAFIRITEYDEDAPLTSGLIEVDVAFEDGSGLNSEHAFPTGPSSVGSAELAGSLNHTITSYTSDNEIAAGNLKLQATQDQEDVVSLFSESGVVYYVAVSPGVLQVKAGDLDEVLLTGFEYLRDLSVDPDGNLIPADDVYVLSDLSDSFGDIQLLDDFGIDDHDTVIVDDTAIGFDEGSAGTTEEKYVDPLLFWDLESDPPDSNENHVLSLESLNDAYGFDWDILDLRGLTDNDVFVFGDENDQDGDGTVNSLDADYVFPSDDALQALLDADDDDFVDADRDIADDDVILGDLGLYDGVFLFPEIWFSNDSLEDGDSFVLVQDGGSTYGLGELEVDGDALFETDANGLNFSLVDTGITLSIDGSEPVEVVGSKGADIISGGGGGDLIEGGAGADELDGGTTAEVQTIDLSGALAIDGNFASFDWLGLGNLVLSEAAVADIDYTDGDAEVVDGAGLSVVGAQLAALLNANLVQVNLDWQTAFAAPGEVVTGFAYASGVLTIEFRAGFDIANDADLGFTPDTGTFNVSATSTETEGSDGGADGFIYNSASEGSDSITGFVSGVDGLLMSKEEATSIGSLIDDNNDGAVDYVNEVLVLQSFDTGGFAPADLTNLTKVAAEFEENFALVTASAADDALLLLESDVEGLYGVYFWDSSDTDNTFEAGELKLIAIVEADDMGPDVFYVP